MSEAHVGNVLAARRALHLWAQKDLAAFLGVTPRTVQRHFRTGGIPPGGHLEKLLRALHPNHPELLAKLAHSGGVAVASLGLPAVAKPPPAKRGPPPPQPEHAAVMLVAAAADALGLAPSAVRPAVVALYDAARAYNVDLNALGTQFGKAKK